MPYIATKPVTLLILAHRGAYFSAQWRTQCLIVGPYVGQERNTSCHDQW